MLGFAKFGLGKKKISELSAEETITFHIDGMHCTSCSMNIDGELEDTTGVVSASTSYAQAQTQVRYQPDQVSEAALKNVIEGLGYRVK